MNEAQPLAAELHRAEETLKSTLREACAADVVHADTGELIKVEEMLAIASDAAKRAISIRRKRRHGGTKAAKQQASAADAPSAPDLPVPMEDVPTAPEHRTFSDSDGVMWTVRAVYPLDRTDARHARLLGTFQQGWLSFECETRKRRLSPIPPDWATADDLELQDLCLRAEEAPTRRTDERPSGPDAPLS